MTPRQLKYFLEIARTGSMTIAASALHIAQPALSHHIAAMEEELGVPLLERHARGVRLTIEGQRLLDRAAAILRQLERLPDDVRDAASQARGTVRLCVVSSVAPVLTAPLFRLVNERLPDVRLQLSTGLSRDAQALVEARRVDLALLPTAHELPRLEVVPAFEEHFCIFGPKKALKGKGPVPFRAIATLPLVAPDRDHDLRKLIERTAVAQNISLDVRYELNSSELLCKVVHDGLACAVMPRNAFTDPEAAGLAVRDIVEPELTRTQSLTWMVEHALTPAGEAVRKLLLELIAAMIEDGRLKARLLA